MPTKKSETKRGRKPSKDSLRAKLTTFMKLSGAKARGRWVSLERIYKKFDIEPDQVGQSAAVRGLLNRGASEKGGLFERNPKVRGTYRVNSKVA